ncbi:hypothetical protein VR45_10765 [Streptomyces sp. NRRL S-495]|nr:hypothetical protein VR45_10765 [Streptomyces sp. NRRL S-495]
MAQVRSKCFQQASIRPNSSVPRSSRDGVSGALAGGRVRVIHPQVRSHRIIVDRRCVVKNPISADPAAEPAADPAAVLRARASRTIARSRASTSRTSAAIGERSSHSDSDSSTSARNWPSETGTRTRSRAPATSAFVR